MRRAAAWARSGNGPVDLLVSVVLAVAVLGPMLTGRGFVLRGDMVFVPDQPWKAAWLGLDGRVPRFVPGDAFVWLLGTVLPGDLVQKAVLLGAFVLGGLGVARVLARHGVLPRVAGVTLFLWNPWVDQRLGIGQWGVLVGYLLLPWVLLAAERVRERRPGGWPALVAVLAVAAVFSPASGLVALAVALGQLVVGGSLRLTAGAVAWGVGVNLPWILPSLLRGGTLSAPAGQFEAFATRGESALGAVGSVLSLGGIWKASVVAPERESAVVVGLAVALSAVAVAGLLRPTPEERARVLGLAVVAVPVTVVALLSAVPAVSEALDALAQSWPPAGILRDAHRYLGPAALALAVGLATSVARLRARAGPGREGLTLLAALLAVAPVLCLPSLAWGRGGDLRPVDYPEEWAVVADRLPEGRTVVLPWRGGYRGFAWNDRRAGLDPAPRYFAGDVLIDDRLDVGTTVLASEDPLLRAVGEALEGEDPAPALRALGVRSVLVQKDNAPPETDGWSGARVRHDGPGLRLLDLGASPADLPQVARDGLGPGARAAVVATDVAVLLVALGGAGLAMRRSRVPRCTVRETRILGGIR